MNYPQRGARHPVGLLVDPWQRAARRRVASASPTTITGTLTEFKIALSATSAPAGTVIFKVTNGGTIVHEFVILKTDTLAKDLPLSGDSVDEGAFNAIGEVEETEAGEPAPSRRRWPRATTRSSAISRATFRRGW